MKSEMRKKAQITKGNPVTGRGGCSIWKSAKPAAASAYLAAVHS